MEKAKKVTLKSMRENPLYTPALQLQGNGKLIDFDDMETGKKYRYAQVNVRAIEDCPFRTAGCTAVCYATKGNHVFPSVKFSRSRSYAETLRSDFSDAMIYTIKAEKQSKRYADSVMIVRIHESGDFYSFEYLQKWVKVFKHFKGNNGVMFVFYTKSFPFFLQLSNEEKKVLNDCMESGNLAMNLSMDDTVSIGQKKNYLAMLKAFPKANTYYCTEHTEEIEHDEICDCANCAKCGTCNNANGTKTVVKIHSATEKDMVKYRANIRK